jgi:ParB family chromosome partitioning protein
MASLDQDKKKALGRGLASLIPDAAAGKGEGAPVLAPKKEYFLCDIEKVVPNPDQPRKIFQKEELDELTDSIRAVGILQPITVRPRNGTYEIIAGERRWRAAQRAGLRQVPVLVKDVPEDMKSLQLALIENIQRAELNCIEEALAYQQLVEQYQLSQEEVATKVGKSRVTVANTMRLLRLPAVIREDLAAGKLTMGHARALLALEDANDQIDVRELILKKKLSVRETERKVAEIARAKARGAAPAAGAAPLRDANLVALEEEWHRRFGLPVKIVGDLSKGTVQIRYRTADDLMRLADLLSGKSTPTVLEPVPLVLPEAVAEADEVPASVEGQGATDAHRAN